MGVHGLWELLAPVGRRVSVETLAGKKLAIDASIWMIQFMKAMRDEKGEMVRNAHILGFFRRICKLLFLRTKPVFVFDGGTPALKRRTVIARRRQRENAQTKIRKTAEKLLLNHLKKMRLKEIAADLEKQTQNNDAKGKNAIVEEPDIVQNTEKGNDDVATSFNQEELDELLAASLAAEESEGFHGDTSTSGAGTAQDELWEDEDEDEEMILPEMQGKIDPAVLASLPPSMQLDLLVQMRERLMAENRQNYQKVKKAPARFSELQIQSYLKTVAFRREIDGVQKSAAGRGIGGMQISRIASESNREFIFSSSFTGDKQAFTSVGKEKINVVQSQPPPVSNSTSSINKVTPTKRSATAAPTKRSTEAETEKAINDDVETYLDERGRVRVSRLRAMGIRMTRDLQRNLELMKEVEQEREDMNQNNIERNTVRNLNDVSSEIIQNQEMTNKNNNDGMNGEIDKNEDSVIKGTSIEVSFEDNCEIGSVNEDDQLFASLVAGEPVIDFSNDNSASKQSLNSEPDCECEEGVTEDRNKGDPIEGAVSGEGEVDWEDGQLNFTSYQDEKKENCNENEIEWEEEIQETVSKGAQEEEAAFQEAIRRSLKDSMVHDSMNESSKDEEPEIPREIGGVSLLAAEKGPKSETSVMEVNDSEEMFGAFIEVDLDKNNLDQVNNLVGISSGKVESNDLAGKYSTDLRPENLLDSEGVFQAAVDDLSFQTGEVAKLYANDSVTELDGLFFQTGEVRKISVNDPATELIESVNNMYGDNLIEKEDSTSKPSFIDADVNGRLEEEMMFLDKERDELGNEQKKLERNADSVSSEMFVECQELLQMFGLPYIIAPMEAEAQCAFMELSNLVDGVVTDDSDAFLFGARSVYKNIFDDRKYVETYLMKDIENDLGVDREKLIHMALLLGSDYTEGVSGIGIVNAIEVVNAFPEKNGLQEFREWIESPDPSILGNLGNSKRKVSKAGEGSNSCDQSVQEDEVARRKQIFMNKHRNVSKNWHIPSTFPSDAVISAYASPQVDKSTESFSWGKPDLSVLRKLCWEKFNWGTSKADDLLLPVLKEYNKHETQLRLEAFYTFNERFAKIRSKRIKKAVKGIAGDKSSQLMDETVPQQSGSNRKKRKTKPSENEANQSDNSNQTSNTVKPPKKLKGKQIKESTLLSTLEESSNVSTSVNSKKLSRVRGLKSRGQVHVRAREEKNSSSEDDTETSPERDGNLQFGGVSEPHQIRRSGRVRKTVAYNEFDDLDVESENRNNEGVKPNESFGGEAVDVNKTDGNIFHEGMDIELEDDPFIGETELTYDTGKINTSQTNGNPIEDYLGQSELPKEDYLQSGGGFCVDEEDEQNEKVNHASSPSEELIPEKPGNLNSPDNEIDRSVVIPIVNEKAQIEEHLLDAENDESGIEKARCLRAMPNLRKKRRRQT